MRVLITGHRGFVGRHFAERLEATGHYVMGMDTQPPDQALDIREYLDHRIADIDLAIHCAAVVGGRTMIDGAPLDLAIEDLSIDAAFFKWAALTRPKRVVYFSSSAAYPTVLQTGDPPTRLHEKHLGFDHMRWIGRPDQTYGWVKVTGEMLAAEARAIGIPVYVFRPFSGYGEDQHPDYPFPNYIRRALDRGDAPEGTFDVWGDGEQVRDWVHIDDVVQTVLQAVSQCDAADGPWNICSGRGTSFIELAQLCVEATARPGLWRHTEIVPHLDKPVGVRYRVGDPTKSHAIWTPKVSLEEGIRRACAAMSPS